LEAELVSNFKITRYSISILEDELESIMDGRLWKAD
jgi:hypothetical protein